MYKLIQYDSLRIRSETPIEYVVVLAHDGVKRVLQGRTTAPESHIPADGVDDDSEIVSIRLDNDSSETASVVIAQEDSEAFIVEMDLQQGESLSWDAVEGWVVTDSDGDVVLNLDIEPPLEVDTESVEEAPIEEVDAPLIEEETEPEESLTGLNPLGEWEECIYYDADDIVTFGDTSYRCREDHYDINPVSGEDCDKAWEVFDTFLLNETTTTPRVLRGPPGTRGKPGEKGDKGDKGSKGDKGEQGVKGKSGRESIDGVDGKHGRRGKDGRDGLAGLPGPKGDRGEIGGIGLRGPAGIASETLPTAGGLIWVGPWMKFFQYFVNDVVSRNGSSYICTKEHKSDASNEPGVGRGWHAFWDTLAKRGSDGLASLTHSGSQGSRGFTGPAGAAGETGPAGPAGVAGAAGSLTSIAGFIHGCGLVYVSDTTVTVSTGLALDSTNVEEILQDNGSLVIDITTSGAGGLDTGSKTSDTWYAVHVIWDTNSINPVSAIFSLSPTSPTLPSGYTHFRRIGWVRNDATDVIIRFLQEGSGLERTNYYTNIAGQRFVAVGITSGIDFTPIDCSSLVPTTATTTQFNVEAIGGAVGPLQQFIFFADNAAGIPYHKISYHGTLTGAGSTYMTWMPVSASQVIYFKIFNGLISMILGVDGWREKL